jgi:hypothetical protein
MTHMYEVCVEQSRSQRRGVECRLPGAEMGEYGVSIYWTPSLFHKMKKVLEIRLDSQ